LKLLRKDINLSQLQVKFMSVNDVRLLYSALDLMIYPVERQGAIEPPLTVLEAMSCGTAVATLKNSVTERIIADYQDGFLFTNVHELRRIVTNVIEDTVDLKKLAIRSREKILSRYSSEKLRNRYLKFLKLIGGKIC